MGYDGPMIAHEGPGIAHHGLGMGHHKSMDKPRREEAFLSMIHKKEHILFASWAFFDLEVPEMRMNLIDHLSHNRNAILLNSANNSGGYKGRS